ncbi:MAG: hypothetical protein QOJ50_1619, partial [Cryptosporangiaceae bacterium]|nr:hypothetical protein [Cryptosporangiaceae bacterium]
MTVSEHDVFGDQAGGEQADGEQAARPGIDPERLEVCLGVIAELDGLPVDHPDAIRVRRATAQLYKTVKLRRRKDRRDEIATADRAVISATATGAPNRIDDETRGIALRASAAAPLAGVLRRARPCYICKEPYTEVDAFYHQLCPSCAAL